MEEFFDSLIERDDAVRIQRHLDRCPDCRDLFAQEEDLRSALHGLPVPEPSPDFISRSFSTARAHHQKTQTWRFAMVGGTALAACVALWLVVAGQFFPFVLPEQTAAQAISFRLHEQRLVQVVVDAPRDLKQADVLIELPAQLEVAGFPGQREIRWHANLHKGKNLLRLPIVAKAQGTAELVTHITHEDKSKMLSLVMQVSADDLTRKEQSRLAKTA